ncbi:Nitrogen regulation protein NIFR3 [Staphylococcus aureus]|nr:Nitrogen regulation protein NIFR3 [Staphylococcus aureus]SCS13848.1 Nitrogen regulation protein NIFR3 [Staphylococcus aureus]
MVFKLSCVIGVKDINQSNRHYNAYWWGPNKENFEKKFYKQCKLAGPQHREFRKEILQTMQVGEGQQI